MFNLAKNAIFRISKPNKLLITRSYSKQIDPFTKTWKTLRKDIPAAMGLDTETFYPEHADVVIIGGGFIGSAIAYWLKSRAVHGLEVVVLEKDFSYQNVRRNLSLGCLTQHFSLIENIKLAQFCSEFLRNSRYHLVNDIDLQYHPTGSLVLASEKYADKLEKNYTILKEEGQRLDLLTPDQIINQYPWIDVSDVKVGCQSYESEGTFNAWELLKGYILKSINLGAKYVNAEVTNFMLETQKDVLMEGVAPGTYKRINKVVYKTSDGQEKAIRFAVCVLAAGDESSNIAKLANIGAGDGLLSFEFPVQKREFNVYSIENKAFELGLCTPIINDTSGLWLRRNGLDNNLIFGMAPLPADVTRNMDKEGYYKDVILQSLYNRIPSCKNNEIKCLRTESFDCNSFDETGIIGVHPYYNNLYLATGFGKIGCPFSPGIGRALAELVIDSHYKTIDFTRFAFDRILMGEPMVEFNVY